ncbi:dixin-like [Topomyia yanbarensis]|uniref:dixin-like n=1 Tax=Topomyia yanbarensis TaxID=2498891 RepID=UPI00273BE6AC|nr:dixin-like [Topomyia yanbarensis]
METSDEQITPTKAVPRNQIATKTPNSCRKRTPSAGKEFFYRRQNRLLRSELAAALRKCTNLEKIIIELRTLLEDEREKTMQPVDQENSQNELLVGLQQKLHESLEQNKILVKKMASKKIECSNYVTHNEFLQSRHSVMHRNTEILQQNISELTRDLVYRKQINEDLQKRVSAVSSKANIMQTKLNEAMEENGILKKQVERLEKTRLELARHHDSRMSNLILKAEELLELLEKERLFNPNLKRGEIGNV